MGMIENIADIVENELGVPVVLWGQNFQAPTDGSLYANIRFAFSTLIGSSVKFDTDTNKEIKETMMYSTFEVELVSKTTEALERKEEVEMSLRSQFSVRSQEDNNFKVFRIGQIVDLTGIDGVSSLYRFRIPIIVTHKKKKETSVNYYDRFRQVEVTANE